jgi:hypothetical protein
LGGSLLPSPEPSWDAPPLPGGDGSAVLVYSPEIQAELAADRQALVYGLGLLVLLAAATFVTTWRK